MIHDQSPLSHLDDRANLVVHLARQRAEGRYSGVIEPEYVLLALLSAQGLAARVVANLSGSAERVESTIAEVLTLGQRPSPAHIPFSAATEKAFVRAAQQAQGLGDDYIGTEHLLLGLLIATNNVAVRLLQKFGITYDTARAEITRLRADG